MTKIDLDPIKFPPFKPSSHDMRRRITNGDYRPKGKLVNPPYVAPPPHFSPPQVYRVYADALEAKEVLNATFMQEFPLYPAYEASFLEQFFTDLATQFHYDGTSEFAQVMVNIATTTARDNDFSAIYDNMEKLSFLWDIYQRDRRQD